MEAFYAETVYPPRPSQAIDLMLCKYGRYMGITGGPIPRCWSPKVLWRNHINIVMRYKENQRYGKYWYRKKRYWWKA